MSYTSGSFLESVVNAGALQGQGFPQRIARVIAALRRIPLVPSPCLAIALSSALAQLGGRHTFVIVVVGVQREEHAWTPLILGHASLGRGTAVSRACAHEVLRQPLPPPRSTKSVRFARPELSRLLWTADPRRPYQSHGTWSSVRLGSDDTVVEVTWFGLFDEATPTMLSTLECIMTQTAKVIEAAFPQGLSETKTITLAELRVARWLLAGESRRSIAAITGRSTNTISDTIKQLYRKLDVGSVGELGHRLVQVDWEGIQMDPRKSPDHGLPPVRGSA